MILSNKVRLKPTKDQESQLWKSSGTARFIYNWSLGRQEVNYKDGGKFISDNNLRKELTQLKKTEDFKWLFEVSNNVAKQACKDACNAYKTFFKNGKGKPKFKAKSRTTPAFYNDNVKFKVKEMSVLIEKVGWVVTAEQLPIVDKYSNPRITFDGKYWYVSVGVEVATAPVELTGEVLGIDVGVKDLAICSDGVVYKNINKQKVLTKLYKRLKMLQRKLSKKSKTSNNFQKMKYRVKMLHRRIKNIRNNYLHQTTTELVKTKPAKIVVEDLDVRGMMKNKYLADAIAKQSFFEFFRQLSYKCELYGIEFVKANRWFPSSKTCNHCKKVKKDLKLSDRVYKCTCGYVADRDMNAAFNLRDYVPL